MRPLRYGRIGMGSPPLLLDRRQFHRPVADRFRSRSGPMPVALMMSSVYCRPAESLLERSLEGLRALPAIVLARNPTALAIAPSIPRERASTANAPNVGGHSHPRVRACLTRSHGNKA
jgi:hypothetical protein